MFGSIAAGLVRGFCKGDAIMLWSLGVTYVSLHQGDNASLASLAAQSKPKEQRAVQVPAFQECMFGSIAAGLVRGFCKGDAIMLMVTWRHTCILASG